jgi:hypothetical protein
VFDDRKTRLIAVVSSPDGGGAEELVMNALSMSPGLVRVRDAAAVGLRSNIGGVNEVIQQLAEIGVGW